MVSNIEFALCLKPPRSRGRLPFLRIIRSALGWPTHRLSSRIALGQPLRHDPKEPPACQVPAYAGFESFDPPVSMTAF